MSEQYNGRVFAAEQLVSKNMDAADLIEMSVQCLEQALEREDYDQAEFLIGVGEHARCFLYQHMPPTRRHLDAPYEILYLNLKDKSECRWFCERDKTRELVEDLIKKAGENFAYLLVKQAYFEEVGMLFLTATEQESKDAS